MTTAAKFGKIDWETMRPAAEQMATLNAESARAMVAAGARAATDVTGFGLMGHGRNLARGSGGTLVLEADALPIFPGALELARDGVASGGSKRGRANLAGQVHVDEGIDEGLVRIVYDAETSGGLLVVLGEAESARFEQECRASGQLAVRVGRIAARSEVAVALVAADG